MTTTTETWTPTTDELVAVANYRAATAGTRECLMFPEHEIEGIPACKLGPAVPGDPTAAAAWRTLRSWVEAVDTLQSELGITWGEHAGSPFARAFVNREASDVIDARRRLIEALASYYCPDYFNPTAADESPDLLCLSNGYAGQPDEEDHACLYHFDDEEPALLDAMRRRF